MFHLSPDQIHQAAASTPRWARRHRAAWPPTRTRCRCTAAPPCRATAARPLTCRTTATCAAPAGTPPRTTPGLPVSRRICYYYFTGSTYDFGVQLMRTRVFQPWVLFMRIRVFQPRIQSIRTRML
jgi:hypothetical protein